MNTLSKFREPVNHELKIYPEFFSAVCTGLKRAELRKNDRDYRVGDTLHLMETPRGSSSPTGEYINATITHIADVGEWLPGHVLLSIQREGFADERKEREAAVPVAWRKKESGWCGTVVIQGKSPLDCGYEPLYTAPPAQPVAVPSDKAITAYFDTLALDTARDIMCDVNRRSDFLGGDVQLLARIQCRIDEACRAAMLNQAPVKQPASNSPVIPDGWKLVPIEPTAQMIWAAKYVMTSTVGWDSFKEAYVAMLAAAPGKEG